jgi:uncharacterized membrane protein AbrB (regulator of aidB expression)
LALSLNGDPVFVGAHQLARFLTVSLSLPVFTHLFTRGREPHEQSSEETKNPEDKGGSPG